MSYRSMHLRGSRICLLPPEPFVLHFSARLLKISLRIPWDMATQPLFVLYTILSFSALAAYGGAVLTTHMLPRWLGWLAIVYGLAGLLFVWFAAGDVPPFLHYLLPIVIGVLLLLPRYQVPGKHEEHSLNEQ